MARYGSLYQAHNSCVSISGECSCMPGKNKFSTILHVNPVIYPLHTKINICAYKILYVQIIGGAMLLCMYTSTCHPYAVRPNKFVRTKQIRPMHKRDFLFILRSLLELPLGLGVEFVKLVQIKETCT